METHRGADAIFEVGDATRFTGEVRLSYGPTSEAMGGTGVAMVSFEPGARTFWHSHPGGQFLYIVRGRGRVRSDGADGVVALPGDILYVPPGEKHFHGGAPDSPMVHLAVNGGGVPDWGAQVTDAEYGAGF